jgi:DNA-damage-inducible protein J
LSQVPRISHSGLVIAAEKRFEPLKPNDETVAAMNAARRGELVKVGKPDKLLRSLNAGG